MNIIQNGFFWYNHFVSAMLTVLNLASDIQKYLLYRISICSSLLSFYEYLIISS